MRKLAIKRMLENVGALKVRRRAELVFTSPMSFEGGDPEPYLRASGEASRWCAWIEVDGKNYGLHMGRDHDSAVDRLLEDVSVDLRSIGMKEKEGNRVRLRAFLASAVPSVRRYVASAGYKRGFSPKQITRALVPSAHRLNNKLDFLEVGGGEPAKALLREVLRFTAEHSEFVKERGMKPEDAATVFRDILARVSSLDNPGFLRHVSDGRLPNYGDVALRRLLPALEETWSSLQLRLGHRDDSPFIRMVRVALNVAGVKGIDPRRASRRRVG